MIKSISDARNRYSGAIGGLTTGLVMIPITGAVFLVDYLGIFHITQWLLIPDEVLLAFGIWVFILGLFNLLIRPFNCSKCGNRVPLRRGWTCGKCKGHNTSAWPNRTCEHCDQEAYDFRCPWCRQNLFTRPNPEITPEEIASIDELSIDHPVSQREHDGHQQRVAEQRTTEPIFGPDEIEEFKWEVARELGIDVEWVGNSRWLVVVLGFTSDGGHDRQPINRHQPTGVPKDTEAGSGRY